MKEEWNRSTREERAQIEAQRGERTEWKTPHPGGITCPQDSGEPQPRGESGGVLLLLSGVSDELLNPEGRKSQDLEKSNVSEVKSINPLPTGEGSEVVNTMLNIKVDGLK